MGQKDLVKRLAAQRALDFGDDAEGAGLSTPLGDLEVSVVLGGRQHARYLPHLQVRPAVAHSERFEVAAVLWGEGGEGS